MVVWPSLALSFLGQTNPVHSAVLTCHIFQPFVHLGGPQLDLPQFVSVPEFDTVLQMWPHKCWIEGNNHFLSVTGYFFNKPAQCAAGFYCCKDILLTHVQFLLQESRSLFAKPLLISWHPGYSKCRTQFLPLLSVMTSGMPVDTDAHFTHTIHKCNYNYLFVTVSTRFIDMFCLLFVHNFFFFFFLEKNNSKISKLHIYARRFL